jgi:hypothetical protein
VTVKDMKHIRERDFKKVVVDNRPVMVEFKN